jgi:hypothetical protein
MDHLQLPVWALRGSRAVRPEGKIRENPMNGFIYLVGLVVVVIAVLSFFGLH